MSLVVALVPTGDGKRQFEDAILDYLRERDVAVVDLDHYGFERQQLLRGRRALERDGHRRAAAVLADVLADRSDTARAEPAVTSDR